MLPMPFQGERLGACTDCRRFWGKFRAGEVSKEGPGVPQPGTSTGGPGGAAPPPPPEAAVDPVPGTTAGETTPGKESISLDLRDERVCVDVSAGEARELLHQAFERTEERTFEGERSEHGLDVA